jgi:hypothetical protein
MTRPLAALERFFERLFESPAARLFQTGLEPVQVQRRLERALDAGHRAGTGFAPDRFAVYVNPEDGDALADLWTTLEAELAEGLRARARQQCYRLAQRPIVTILADASVPRGEVAIEAGYGPAAHDTAGAGSKVPPGDGPGAAPGGRSAAAPGGDMGSSRAIGDGDSRPFLQDVEPPRVEAPAPLQAWGESPPVGAPLELPAAVLLVTAPDMPEGEFPLIAATVTIGRGPDNDLVLPDHRVSRRHGIISVRRGTLVYTDLGSSNGTLVNGRVATEVALGHGDVLRLGDSTITVLGTG